MEYIFTPWRYDYVSTVDQREGCIFCERPAAGDDRENLIVTRGERCFVMLNLYPYSTGHLMIAPYEHTGTIESLDRETLADMMQMAQRCMEGLRDAFSPEGFNVGINIARVAGAGIVEHVHMHVVPRWKGDSNFMPVCAETRVLPLSLDQVWEALSARLERQS
jgi:ATP adenylyltransferase